MTISFFRRSGLFAALLLFLPFVSAAPPGPISNWTPTFDEEFNGTIIPSGYAGLVSSTGFKYDAGPYPAPNQYRFPVYTSTSTSPITGTNNQWDIGLRYDAPNSLTISGDRTQNVTISGGCLNIVVQNEPASTQNYGFDGYSTPPSYGGCAPNPNNGSDSFAYSSGEITTLAEPGYSTGFAQAYGYFEASIKLPGGMGPWAAFWLLPDRGGPDDGNRFDEGDHSGALPTYGNEIDIMEYMAAWENASHVAFSSSNILTPNLPQLPGNYEDINSLLNPDTTFHRYGIYWNKGTERFYIDDVQVFVYSDPTYLATAPEYIVLDCVASTNDFFANLPYSSITPTLPQTMKVDWVRVWKPTFPGSLPPPTTSDLALGATVWTSSNYNLDHVTGVSPADEHPWDSSFLVDGVQTSMNNCYGWLSNLSTSTNHNTEYVELDLGGNYSFNTVTLYPRTDTNHVGASFPTAFTIQTSPDNKVWTTVVPQTSNYPSPGSAPQPFTFGTVSAEYIKVTGTSLSADPNESYAYRMGFAEITVGAGTPSAGTTIDPFTSPDAVPYNFYNYYNGGGTASASDFGSVSGGVWSPSVTGHISDHFVVNSSSTQLVNVGDSVSLGVKTNTTDPGIGLVLSASPNPSASVNQTEVMFQHGSSGYQISGYTNGNHDTTFQTDYATLTVTETAYNSANQVRTFSVTASGGGISPISTTGVTLVGANCYIGLLAYSDYNGMGGATAKNFVLTRAGVSSSPSNTGSGLADGALDPKWTITASPNGAEAAYVVPQGAFPFPNWFADSATSKWIAPSGTTGAPGLYTYQTTFTLASSTSLILNLAGDDTISGVRLNGTAISVPSGTGFYGFTTITIPASMVGAAGSLETLQIDVTNNGTSNNPTGLRAEVTPVLSQAHNTGVTLADGATDSSWTITASPGGALAAIVVPQGVYPFPYWFADSGTSKWIAPSGTSGVAGVYTYQTTFTLASSTSIVLKVAGDDLISAVRLNGTAVTVPSGTGYSGFTTITIPAAVVGSTGSKTLQVDVTNANNGSPTNPTGLRAELSSP